MKVPSHKLSNFSARATSLSARRCLLVVGLFTSSLVLSAQQSESSAIPPRAGSNWERVKALPIKTGLHVTTDHGGKSCRLFAVTDDTLICAHGSKAGSVIQRAEIKHIKLTHYVRSTLTGAGIGGAIGGISGAIAGRTKPCPPGGGLCFNGLFGPGEVALVFGVGAGVVGSVVGGVTDLARGSSIYARP